MSHEARILEPDGSLSLAALQAALRAKGDAHIRVSRELGFDQNASNTGFTAGAVVYELSNTLTLHCAAGPPTVAEFLCFPC